VRGAKRIALWRWRLWDRDRGLRFDYPLTADSIVLDIGGFKGEWSAALAERFDPWIYIFEPIPEHIGMLRDRFAGNPKVRIFEFGLGASDGVLTLHQCGEGSGLLNRSGTPVVCPIRDIVGVWQELSLSDVDLVKINIEGAEFDLLPRMLAAGLVVHCRDLQIQFHEFHPFASKLRRQIRHQLTATHRPTYSFYFIWENWRIARRAGLR
jgi:FkbM family methyltransferase